jgi:hypothetical protein
MENPMRRMIRIVCIAAVLFLIASCEGKAQGVSDNDMEPESTLIIREEPPQAEPEQEELQVENLEGASLDIGSLSDEEKDQYITGIWYIFFPTPNENWGHYLEPDHNYTYWNYSREAMEQQYFSSDGIWRIQDSEIQVKITSYRMWDRGPEQTPIGFMIPDEANRVKVPVEDDTWHTIGTMESIRTGIVRDGWEFPPRITLHPLRFDKVLDEEQFYYRDRP